VTSTETANLGKLLGDPIWFWEFGISFKSNRALDGSKFLNVADDSGDGIDVQRFFGE
jgi:hypothetical protein